MARMQHRGSGDILSVDWFNFVPGNDVASVLGVLLIMTAAYGLPFLLMYLIVR